MLGLNTKTYETELKKLYKKDKKITKVKKIKKGLKPKIVKVDKVDKLSIASIKSHDNTIVIKFNKPIKRSNMLFYEINSRNDYKDIYDIKAYWTKNTKDIKIKNIKKAKLINIKNYKLRVMLEDNYKIYSNAYIRGGNLFIEIRHNPNKRAKKLIITSNNKQTKPITKISKHNKSKKSYKNSIYASSKTIVIDPGHGGKDSGAIGYKNYKEKVAVLKVAKNLKNLLIKQGYKVYLTRDSDFFIKLSQRTHFANQKHADLFISIHANASPASKKLTLKGIETFFLSPAKTAKANRIAAKENSSAITHLNTISKDTLLNFLNRNKIIQSNKLAIDVQKSILSQIRRKYRNVIDGGVREAPFWVLVGAQMPAILIEIGYITNPTESDRLFNPFYQKLLAKGILHGINNYFIHNQ